MHITSHPHLFQLARWKEYFGYKLVAELHHPAVELDFLIQRLLFPFAVAMLRHTGKNIDAFIAHTQMEKEWLVNNVVNSQKVHVIRLPGIPSQLLKINLLSSPPYDVIYVGRVVPRKGIHMLLMALYKLKKEGLNVKTFIVGPTDHNYFKHLAELISRLGLTHLVEFRGVVGEDQKYELIRQHKTLVMPSMKDYTPNAIMEAEALGTPVVATKVGAIPETVIDGETGLLVEPNNVDRLAEAIKILLVNEDLRRRMSVRAREWAKNFTLDKAVDELERRYELLIRAGA